MLYFCLLIIAPHRVVSARRAVAAYHCRVPQGDTWSSLNSHGTSEGRLRISDSAQETCESLSPQGGQESLPNSLFCLSVFGFLHLLWLSVWFYSWMSDRVGVSTAKEVSVGGRALCAFSSNKLHTQKKVVPPHGCRDKNSPPAGFWWRRQAGAAWVRTGAALLSLGSQRECHTDCWPMWTTTHLVIYPFLNPVSW